MRFLLIKMGVSTARGSTFGAIDTLDWLIRLIAVLTPFVIGAVSIAEERRLNVHFWHLSLPPSRRTQWMVKMLVCLVLGWTLSMGFFLGVDLSQNSSPLFQGNFMDWNRSQWILVSLVTLTPIMGLLISCLASSITSGFVQAISWVFGFCLCFLLLAIPISRLRIPGDHDSNPGDWFLFFSLMPLLIMCPWLTFRNFVHAESSRSLFRFTVLRLLIAYGIVMVLTVAVFYRS